MLWFLWFPHVLCLPHLPVIQHFTVFKLTGSQPQVIFQSFSMSMHKVLLTLPSAPLIHNLLHIVSAVAIYGNKVGRMMGVCREGHHLFSLKGLTSKVWKTGNNVECSGSSRVTVKCFTSVKRILYRPSKCGMNLAVCGLSLDLYAHCLCAVMHSPVLNGKVSLQWLFVVGLVWSSLWADYLLPQVWLVAFAPWYYVLFGFVHHHHPAGWVVVRCKGICQSEVERE